NVPQLDRPRQLEARTDLVLLALDQLAVRLQVFRADDVRHRRLVLEGALFGDAERRGQREDRLAVLDRLDPPSAERTPVTSPVDVIDDRDLRVAGAQEVGMQ